MEILQNTLPLVVALAVVATLGYLFGRQQLRRNTQNTQDNSRHRPNFAADTGSYAPNESDDAENQETQQVIRELQLVSSQVRLSLAAHHASVLRFNDSIQSLRQRADGETLRQLGDEAERILNPTRQLSVDIAHAYDELRRHAGRLQMQRKTAPACRQANQRAAMTPGKQQDSPKTSQ
jgi:hypothetical protein